MRVMMKAMLLFLAAVSCPPGAGALQESPADTVDVSGLGRPEPAAAMAALSGRQGVQIDQLNALINANNSSGYLENNNLQSATSGANTIRDNAFGNASGIATVIQNSGNQVLIQNSMIVNLTTR